MELFTDGNRPVYFTAIDSVGHRVVSARLLARLERHLHSWGYRRIVNTGICSCMCIMYRCDNMPEDDPLRMLRIVLNNTDPFILLEGEPTNV